MINRLHFQNHDDRRVILEGHVFCTVLLLSRPVPDCMISITIRPDHHELEFVAYPLLPDAGWRLDPIPAADGQRFLVPFPEEWWGKTGADGVVAMFDVNPTCFCDVDGRYCEADNRVDAILLARMARIAADGPAPPFDAARPPFLWSSSDMWDSSDSDCDGHSSKRSTGAG